MAMGDASDDKQLLAEEQHRLSTYNNCRFTDSVDNVQLAKAGFYFTRDEDKIKCFACDLKVKASDISKGVDIVVFHREKKPECSFVQKLLSVKKSGRCKTFLSVADSLRFEKARLDTFVDWPVSFMSPADLAQDGFYFLRTRDHCACVFCKGIIGAWEESDTPRGEHLKHFPHCSFLKGDPVGNVPIAQSQVLLKFNNSFASAKVFNPWETSRECNTEDVTGRGRQQPEINSRCEVTTQKMNGITLKDIGLNEYRGPKYKEFITYDNRVNTFKNWPERVTQKPQELAEAGFYYCGPSDHVRCFHCGNGICNWEKDDVPWDIHALWYHKCSFVVLTKGQEYVNKIRKELSETSANSQGLTVTESEIDSLMELDVMRAVCALGFPEGPVRGALRKKIETTGVPFFGFEPCMDAVFMYMEDETRQFLQETYRDDENQEQDELEEEVAELSPLQPSSVNTNRNETSASSVNTNRNETSSASSIQSSSVPSSTPLSTASLPELPPLTVPAPILPLPQLRIHSPSTSLPSLPVVQPPERRNTSEAPATSEATVPEPSRAGSSHIRHSQDSQRQTLTHIAAQSDHGEERKPQTDASPESSTTEHKKGICSASVEQKSSVKLQEELDRAREVMMCKVCLDAEMTIVFLPCSHMAACASCAVNLSTCPVCREEIKFTIKPIFS